MALYPYTAEDNYDDINQILRDLHFTGNDEESPPGKIHVGSGEDAGLVFFGKTYHECGE
jgi:hypothetical protein